jgi:hypothetical protein
MLCAYVILDWRDVPLFSAISFGIQSVEADVWLINGTLFVSVIFIVCKIGQGLICSSRKVGHEEAALTPNRTFHSLYVDPLVSLIQKQNPKDQFTVNQTTPKYVSDNKYAADVR